MGINNVLNGKWLYHLTKMRNLESICRHGLRSRDDLIRMGLAFADVADPDIMSERCELGLDRFVPFHFHPYSSFDVAVKNSNRDDVFIYICINRQLARTRGYKVLLKHPLSLNKVRLYEFDAGMEAIDWDVMQQKGRNDEYAKCVKMAECLSDARIMPQDFACIGVRDETHRQKVIRLLQQYGIINPPPFVSVYPWFSLYKKVP